MELPVITDEEIGARVFGVMWRKKISQASLAKQLGISQPTLSLRLHGERRWLVTDLVKVAAVLDTPLDEFVRHQGLEPRTR